MSNKKISKIIGIVGTRRRNSNKDYKIIKAKFLELYRDGDFICSGLCPKGGDRFAFLLANLYIPPDRRLWFPPEWEKYGKTAGFIRNTKMARVSEYLIACIAKDRKGGTEDTIKKFITFHGKKNLYIV